MSYIKKYSIYTFFVFVLSIGLILFSLTWEGMTFSGWLVASTGWFLLIAGFYMLYKYFQIKRDLKNITQAASSIKRTFDNLNAGQGTIQKSKQLT